MELKLFPLFYQEIADAASKLVDVTYTDQKPPILTIEDAMTADSWFSERGADFKYGSYFSFYFFSPSYWKYIQES